MASNRATPPFVSMPTTEPHPRPIRILYAEDVAELRALARAVLSIDGHHIECVIDGLEALELLKEDPDACDLLITDHHMPRMDGLDLVRHLRALPFHARIMVFSSELNPAVADEYERLGVDKLLFKPVYPSHLRHVVAEMFPAEVHA